MGLSKFNWSVLHDDGKVVKVYTENIDIALSIAYARTQDEQPLAVIRGSLYMDDDAIDGADGERKEQSDGKVEIPIPVESTTLVFNPTKPTVEYALVVRCKDCQWFDANSDYYDSYCDKNGISVEDDFFCADGERKEQDDA